MNENFFNIYKKYRERKYERDLEYVKMESGLKGKANINEQERLRCDFEDEVEMEKEKMFEWKKEQKRLRRQGRIPYFMAIMTLLGFLGTVIFSSITIENSKEANDINRLAAEQEYYNQQPFLIIIDGNGDATNVRIKNVGGGPAKDIFFLKHHTDPAAIYEYALTKEESVILGMAAGAEGDVNLNSQFMDELNTNDVLGKIQCLSKDSLMERINTWVMIFYRNIQGELFVSYIVGTGSPYSEAVMFEKIICD